MSSSFRDEFEKSKEAAYHKVVASKILDLMDKLRESNNPNNRKRWIWELLQNAKDVRNPSLNGVDISVTFASEENKVIFQHNGSPFSVQNITFLVEQISTKERSEDNSEETTGKFGTGFLTTHLLSEIVDIEGILTGDGLPYKKIQVRLDRSSDDIEGIIASVQKSLKQAESVESAPDLELYDPQELSTSFSYHLNHEGQETAKSGLLDLQVSLPITLSFLDVISSVTVNGQVLYIRDKALPLEFSDDSTSNLKYSPILIVSSHSGDTTCEFIQCVGELSTILISVKRLDDSFELTQLSESLPRLFCDFPLVGSEFLSLPFVLNSSAFHPTEPRDGIFLTDKDTKKTLFNKKIISEAVSSYVSLIDIAARQQWKNLHVLAHIKKPEASDWLSEHWYELNVIDPILQKLYTTPIVCLSDGSMSALIAKDYIVDIPFNKKQEVREAIWELVKDVEFFRVPERPHIDAWYDIFCNKVWNNEHRLTIERLSKYLSESQNLDKFSEDFKIEDPIEFLNRYFEVLELALENSKDFENSADFLEKKGYALIPNQEGVFCMASDLNQDLGIDDCLKVIAKDLHSNLYAKLAHTSISIASQLKVRTRNDVIEGINIALKSPQVESEKKRQACNQLTSLFVTSKKLSDKP